MMRRSNGQMNSMVCVICSTVVKKKRRCERCKKEMSVCGPECWKKCWKQHKQFCGSTSEDA